MKNEPSVIVLAHSENWCAGIKRQFKNHRLSWVLNAEQLASEVIEGRANVAIIEISHRHPEKTCLPLAGLANSPFQLAMFAVGGYDLDRFSTLLQATGFFAWFGSLLQLPDLERRVNRYQKGVTPAPKTLEQEISDNLPWSAHRENNGVHVGGNGEK